MAAGVGMAHRESNEENDYLCNRQFEEQVQDQVPDLYLHVHVVLWDESPNDAAEKGDENVDEYPQAGGEGETTRETGKNHAKGGDHQSLCGGRFVYFDIF
ncbi:MAG: hypothetical protein LV473_07145 [Nitrospira sp.]|nr:hypothetical protein [Nitrospira sp.]